MKRSIRLIAVAFAAVFALTSCQKGATQSKSTVVIWHWMTDRDEAFQELAKRYQKETGKSVQFQLYAPSDVYSQKVRVGAQTNSLPDVYGILGDSRDLSIFIGAGDVADLTSALGDGPGSWKSRFYPEALNTAYFAADNQWKVPQGYYGIPIDVTTIPMIYNKKLFTKAGLDPNNPPATWDAFLDAGAKLKKAGVTGFVSGWGETWLIFSFVTDLAHNLMGTQKVMDTFAGKVPYTDPQWIQVFDAFAKMRQAGFVDPSLVTLGNKSAEQAFATERSGMTFNGSWAVNVYAGMNPAIDYAPFPVPALNPKNPRPVWGGAGSVFMVNAKSPNRDAAIDFLKWMTAKEQMSYLVEQTKNLPSVTDVTGNISPVLQQFAGLMKDSIHPNRFSVSEDPKVQEALTKGIQSILINEKTPQQVAADVEKAKEKAKP